MAQTTVGITPGSGILIDGFATTLGHVRQAIVIGDPTTDAGVAPVSAATGLLVSIAAGSAVMGHVITDSGSTTVLGANSGVDIGKLTANQSVNISQINGITPLMGNGVTGTGSQRVTIASDNTAFAVNATLSAETTKVIGTVNIAAAQTITVTQATGANLHTVIDSGTVTTVSTVTNLAQMNGAALLMGNGVTGTGSQRVTIASDNTPFSIKIDQTTPGTTNAVSIAQIGGTTIVNGGVAGSQSVGGTVATNVAITANPLNLGAQAVSSENAAVTTARQVQLVADLVGKLIVLPYANPENFVSGAITSAMTGTTSTSLIGAPASGLRNYITQITVSNAHATQGTDVIIQDGSGGTTLYTIPAAAVYGGAVVTFPTPLRQPTTATAIFCANVTSGASTKVSASGYKGA